MLGFIVGLALGMIFGLLCHSYRVSPWYSADDENDALMRCNSSLERARARLYSLQRQPDRVRPGENR